MEKLLIELEKVGCDVSDSLRRFANNEKMYLKYLYRFPEENTLSKFTKAFQAKDYESAYNELHTFKGVVGNLGLTVLYELSQEIMKLIKEKEYVQATDCLEKLYRIYKQLIDIIQTTYVTI